MDNIKVVIVDDETRIRQGIERIVSSCGEEWEVVETYNNGKNFLEYYQAAPFYFDLLITDVKMPLMDGLTLIKELKKSTNFEAIVISGFDDFTFLQTAIREGASDYLLKPIDRDEFMEQLDKVKRKIIEGKQQNIAYEGLKQNSEQKSYAQQVELFSQFIWQTPINIPKEKWTNIGFNDASYMLIHAKVNNFSSDGTMDEAEEICERFLAEKAHTEQLNYWKCKGGDHSFWILLGEKKRSIESILETTSVSLLHTMKLELSRRTNQTIFILISEAVGLSLLEKMKEKISAYLSIRLLYSGDHILSTMQIEQMNKNQKEFKATNEINSIIKQIALALERIEKQKVNELLQDYFYVLKKSASIEELEQNVQNLCIQVIYSTIQGTSIQMNIPFIQEGLTFTKTSESLEKLQLMIGSWINRVIEQLEIIFQEQQGDPVVRGKKWINDHLHENIKIEKIAKEVYLNPTYFCEIFKSQTGETVLDYITRKRLQKAKQLLIATNLKVYEIAEKVGYSDTKYFSKLFKKHYSYLPSKFKEKNRIEEKNI
ncbi:response regulator [Niallia nealsonii]|nr:response regulator [Niallia nealsonii]